MDITSKIIGEMQAQRNEVQRANLMRFFKTGKGEYGEGDQFLGLTCPQTRQFVKRYHAEVQLDDVDVFLQSEYHEVRLFGLLVMVEKFQRQMPRSRGLNPLDKMMQRDA
ncbi:MAG: DNA alkylation repair protein, partial [Bacteroidales bacterium]|nr:DNA alkylation repair protein [Bacteroidales bacterium]